MTAVLAAVAPPWARLARPIVVATDGSAASKEAFVMASAIQGRSGLPVHVLSVLEPLSSVLPFDAGGYPVPPEWNDDRVIFQEGVIREQMASLGPVEWPVEVQIGRPAEAIVDFARRLGAGLIVIGSSRHGALGRLLGQETAVEIARLTDIPLLAAASTSLPERVVIALGLAAADHAALPVSLSAVSVASSVSVVHVRPRGVIPGPGEAAVDAGYDLALLSRYKEVSSLLDSVRVRSGLVVRSGDASGELLSCLESERADLVVVGVRRRVGRRAWLGGRMAACMLRSAPCSVLVVPQQPARSSLETTVDFADSYLWPSALAAFTARNSARLATLEVDDPSSGSFVASSVAPFRGIDYDHKNRLVTISMGLSDSVEGHLTRAVHEPGVISVLKLAGRDTALMIQKGEEKTLLLFNR